MSDSYKTTLKSTSIFGGVQLFKIIIQIIKTKIIAVLLGANGVGIISLFSSTSNLITKISSLGLETSAVKEVSESNSKSEVYHLRKTVAIVKKTALMTGLLGAIIMLVFSTQLSQLTFNSEIFSIAFKWLSLSILFNQIAAANNSILQGIRKIFYLAKSNLLGSFLSLIICIPAYYYIGEDAIPFVFLMTSIILAFLSFFYLNKINITKIKIPFQKLFSESKGLLMLGLVIAINGIFSSILVYTLQIYISNLGGVEQVGLFTAGFVIINSYVGLIFNAMGTDYFPRLASVAKYNNKLKKLINEQIDVALIIVGPIIIIFMIFLKWIILLLYSIEFLEIKEMLYYAAFGMFFKTIAWAIAYVFLAKSDKKTYLISETLFNLYFFIFNCLSYSYFGLTGLGISFLLSNFFFFLQVFYLAKNKYNFTFNSNTLKIIIIQLIFGISCFGVIKFSGHYSYFVLLTIILFSSIGFSYFELNKMVDLKKILKINK